MTVTALTFIEPALVSSMELCVIKSSCFARNLLIVVKCGCPNHSLSLVSETLFYNFLKLTFLKTFLKVCMYRTKGNSPSLHQRRFRLAIRGNLFTRRVVKHWNTLARNVVESSSLKASKRCLDVAI